MLIVLLLLAFTEDDAFSLYRLASECMKKDDYKQAIDLFTRAIKMDPQFVDAYLGRGYARSSQGEMAQALADMNEAIRIDPGSALAYHSRGSLYGEKKEYDRALADFAQALKLDSSMSSVYIDRATIWIKKKDYARALAEYQDALKVDQKAYYAYNGFAWLYATCPDAKFRDGKKAVTNAMKACEMTQWHDPFCLDTLGTAYAEAGDYEKAIQYQKQALDNEWFAKRYGQKGQQRLKLYEAKKPFRDEP